MQPEARLVRQILLAIDAPDVWVAVNTVGQAFHASLGRELCPACRAASNKHRVTMGLGTGSPDLIGAVGGRLLAVEVKTPTGKLREEQIAWHAAARARGVEVFTCRTVDEARAAITVMRDKGA